MLPGVALQEDADGQRAQYGQQEVEEAAPVADQRTGRTSHETCEHHEDEGRFVEAQSRDRRSGSEAPCQAHSGHCQAYSPQGFLGGEGALCGAQTPPAPQPSGGRDRADPPERESDRLGIPHHGGDDRDEHDVDRLGKRAARDQLPEGCTSHLGLDAGLLVGGERRRVSRHGSIWGDHGRLRNIARPPRPG